jgi:hypothetical protein
MRNNLQESLNMPRPKPPEPLHNVGYRLTDAQVAKIRRNGGPEWLRHTINAAPDVPLKPPPPADRLAVRNKAIAADRRNTKRVAADHGLDLHYTYSLIRRQRQLGEAQCSPL